MWTTTAAAAPYLSYDAQRKQMLFFRMTSAGEVWRHSFDRTLEEGGCNLAALPIPVHGSSGSCNRAIVSGCFFSFGCSTDYFLTGPAFRCLNSVWSTGETSGPEWFIRRRAHSDGGRHLDDESRMEPFHA